MITAPTVNNVTITADYTLPDGSQVLLISEVLFVSEAVVSRLHQVDSFFTFTIVIFSSSFFSKLVFLEFLKISL